jgi:hypothetical protein
MAVIMLSCSDIIFLHSELLANYSVGGFGVRASGVAGFRRLVYASVSMHPVAIVGKQPGTSYRSFIMAVTETVPLNVATNNSKLR